MSQSRKSILLIGPFPKPISGVSLANKVVKELLEKNQLFKVEIIDTSFPVFKEDIGKFSFKKALFFLKLNLQISKMFKSKIIYMTPGQTFFGVFKYAIFICLGAILKKEMIIHVHGNYLGFQYKMLSGVRKKSFYFLISKFTKGIVLSNSLKSNLIPFLPLDDIFSLPNFAENYLISENPSLDNKELRIIYLSNLMKEKGILELLEALEDLEKREIDYSAKIAGNIDVSLVEEIQNKLKSLKRTKYIGIVSGNKKKNLLNWGNIFVLPTYYKMEGQPISILEAMATKNLIITTKHAGIQDIVIDGENGFFVLKNDPKSLAEKFIYLSDEKEKIEIISNSNKDYFLKNFTLKEFENKLLKIIKE